jgi:hypothetical protein
MFGFNKKTTVATINQPLPKMPSIMSNIVKDYPNADHVSKLTLFTTSIELIPDKIKDELRLNNMRCFVPFSYIAQYKYHAQLWTWNQFDNVINATYEGDIPDTVLDKAILARHCGIKVLTIHSMMPMPIRLEKCDPALIGWYHTSLIEVNGKGNIIKMPWNNCEVCIIAIWDYDKEVEIF